MGYAVEFYFDKKSELMLLELCKKLSSTCLNYNSRPHISLSVHEELNVETCIELIRDVFADVRKIPVRLSSIGVFKGDDNVLFIAPDANDLITDLHTKFHSLLEIKNISCSDFYKPDNWLPHCTIDFNVPTEFLEGKEKLAHKIFNPINVQIAGISIVKFLPLEEIFTMHLHL